jgi:hypothetical protein
VTPSEALNRAEEIASDMVMLAWIMASKEKELQEALSLVSALLVIEKAKQED